MICSDLILHQSPPVVTGLDSFWRSCTRCSPFWSVVSATIRDNVSEILLSRFVWRKHYLKTYKVPKKPPRGLGRLVLSAQSIFSSFAFPRLTLVSLGLWSKKPISGAMITSCPVATVATSSSGTEKLRNFVCSWKPISTLSIASNPILSCRCWLLPGSITTSSCGHRSTWNPASMKTLLKM